MKTTLVEDQKTKRQAEQVLYTAKTQTIGGRDGGSARSSDGNHDIKLSVPGKLEPGTNPEQLFAAGWSACFIGAMKIAAGKMKVRFPEDGKVDAEVDLRYGAEGYSLQARLNVSLPGLDNKVAQAIVDTAHNTCPYSKAVKGNVEAIITLT